MSYNWGPHYIVPSELMKTYSGSVLLREEYNEDLLQKELEEMGLKGSMTRVNNPWYYRNKKNDTWIKAGESDDIHSNFPVRWNTTALENGQYEILGMMHVFVKSDGKEVAIARQNIVEVTVEN